MKFSHAMWVAFAFSALSAVLTASTRPDPQKNNATPKSAAYPAPRWPSYLKKPKSVEEILPHARDLVRNKAGFGAKSPRLGLRLVPPREEVTIENDTTAADFDVESLPKDPAGAEWP